MHKVRKQNIPTTLPARVYTTLPLDIAAPRVYTPIVRECERMQSAPGARRDEHTIWQVDPHWFLAVYVVVSHRHDSIAKLPPQIAAKGPHVARQCHN